jgi:uncharacterized protein (UPF0147 family)
VILQELDFRERNLRYVEFSMMVTLAEKGLMILEDMASTYEKDSKVVVERKNKLHEAVQELLALYGAELHQDNYVPAIQAAQKTRLRRKKEEQAERARRQASALARVEKFGEDPIDTGPKSRRAKMPPHIANSPPVPPNRRDKKPPTT